MCPRQASRLKGLRGLARRKTAFQRHKKKHFVTSVLNPRREYISLRSLCILLFFFFFLGVDFQITKWRAKNKKNDKITNYFLQIAAKQVPFTIFWDYADCCGWRTEIVPQISYVGAEKVERMSRDGSFGKVWPEWTTEKRKTTARVRVETISRTNIYRTQSRRVVERTMNEAYQGENGIGTLRV